MDDPAPSPQTGPPPTELAAGWLHLRPWQPGDEPAVLAACRDPEIVRWTEVPHPYTAKDAQDYVSTVAAEGWATGTALTWAVCESTTAELLAAVSLRRTDEQGTWDVGYWTVPAARGRGVVPQALAVVCRWGFAVLAAQRVEWRAAVGNTASRRAAEKAGFRVEGTARRGLVHRGRRVDCWVGALLPGDPQTDTARFPDPGTLTAGGDLTVRRWRPADADGLAAVIDGEPDALPPGPGTSAREHARWWTSELAPELWADGDGAPLGVFDGAEVVGSVQLFCRGRRQGTAEVGVWIAPGARRRGVALAALTSALEWAEPALHLARVEWHASVGNAASLALADRLGFVREGVARSALPGDPRGDAVVLARTRRPAVS